MAEMVYERARREAKAVREGYPIGTSGTRDLEALAMRLGAYVFFDQLDSDQAGFIVKDEGKSFAEIYINSRDILERQRFTLAHEIGHLVDRRMIARDEDYSFMDYRDMRNGYDLHEFFANEFAGELLMPAIPFLSTVVDRGVYAAASEFGVSPAAAQRRFDRLSMHPPEELNG